MEELTDQDRERALVRGLYVRAKQQGKVPCPLCSLKTDTEGILIWVEDAFFSVGGLADHIKHRHRKVRAANIKCVSCGGYFETKPDKEKHVRHLPSDH